jgi:iron complex outermembrane receptor protein
MTINRKSLRAAMLSAGCLATTTGIANAAVAADGLRLEEVLVTARKRDESLQSVPVAVTSFSADELATKNLTDTVHLAEFTPALFIEPNPGANLTSAKTTMRGQVQVDSLSTLDPSVGWYIDDVYLARTPGTMASMFDLERVEILKGPQGTLYGRNTTGGAIKLITTKADSSAGITGFVIGGVGDFGDRKLGGAINIPVIEGVLALRLAALKDERTDGIGSMEVVRDEEVARMLAGNPYHDFATHRRDAGQKDSELYRVGVTWTPRQDLLVRVNHEKTDYYANALLYNVLQQQPADIYNDGRANWIHEGVAESQTSSLTIEYDFNDDLATKFVYGYREMDSSFHTDVDGGPAVVSVRVKPLEQGAEQHSYEWQLAGTAMDGGLEWLTGLYYFEERGYDFSTSASRPPPMLTPTTVIGSSYDATIDSNKSKSAFVSATLRLTDSVDFTGGLRYTKDSKPVTVLAAQYFYGGGHACRFDAATAPNADTTNCTWSQADDYEYISWSVGFDWQISDAALAYVKSSSASRAGGQNLRGLGVLTLPDGTQVDTFKPFDPETATDIELGYKGQFFDNRVQVNTALYHIWYDDVQQSSLFSVPGRGNTTVIQNTSRARYKGIEVEAKWLVTDALMLGATLGAIDWEFAATNDYLPSTPDLEYTLSAGYQIPAAYGLWAIDLSYSYRGEMYTNTSNTRAQVETFPGGLVDDVSLVNGRISLDLENLGVNLALWGKNLTDEEYTLTPLALSLTGGTLAFGIGEPRSYGLDVKYSF